jgi:hypothetical protein
MAISARPLFCVNRIDAIVGPWLTGFYGLGRNTLPCTSLSGLVCSASNWLVVRPKWCARRPFATLAPSAQRDLVSGARRLGTHVGNTDRRPDETIWCVLTPSLPNKAFESASPIAVDAR